MASNIKGQKPNTSRKNNEKTRASKEAKERKESESDTEYEVNEPTGNWECKMCEVKIDKKSQAIGCERCDDTFCLSCLNKDKQEYKILTRNTDYHW